MSTQEQDILKRISVARGNSEPEQSEPTEEPDVVNVSEEEAPEEEAAETEPTDEVAVSEPEESEEVTEPETSIDDSEELYVEIDGREINLKDIKDWEQGNLRQSDYTRKTQELAEERKTFKANVEQYTEHQQKLATNIATLESIIEEDTLSDEAVKDMREFEPEEYIKYTEKQNNRKEALSKAKETQPVSTVNVEEERAKLWETNPTWSEDGKPTQAYTDDMTLLDGYIKASGYSSDEVASITSAHHWQTLLEAAKYRKLSTKNAAIEKKVRKAPVTTKPRKAAQSTVHDQIKKAQDKLKLTGKAEDAVKLRQLRRQLKE
jgi:hypothetical protein